MDRLFLDANILFSASYREDAGVAVLWSPENVALFTSPYAIQEAKRNLAERDQKRRLRRLIHPLLWGDPGFRGRLRERGLAREVPGGA